MEAQGVACRDGMCGAWDCPRCHPEPTDHHQLTDDEERAEIELAALIRKRHSHG